MFYYEYPVSFSSVDGTVKFNDTSSGDLTCEVCFIDQLEGWTNTVKPVVIANQKAVGDGAYLANRFYAAGRLLTVGGLVATHSELENVNAWNQLVDAAFPWNTDIVVTHQGPVPMYVTARVISDLRVTQWNPTGFRFEVDLECADPFKYDAAHTLSGISGMVGASSGGFSFPMVFPLTFTTAATGVGNVVVLNNIGNAPSLPVITINGQMDVGWRLENTTTSQDISFGIATAAGDVLVIDHNLETAVLNGTPITGLVDGDWWALAKGVNTIKLFGNYYPQTTFTATAKSAWR